jgi:hypothetical protein
MVLRLFSSMRGTRSDSFVANGSQHISSANTPTLVFPTELVQLPCIIQFLQSSWSNTITSIAAPRPRRFSQRTMIGPQTVLQFVVDKDALPSEWPKMVREFWLAHRMILRNHESWDQYTGKETSTPARNMFGLPFPSTTHSRVWIDRHHILASQQVAGLETPTRHVTSQSQCKLSWDWQ